MDSGIVGVRLPAGGDEGEQQARRRRVDEWLSLAGANLERPWEDGDVRIAFLDQLPWDTAAEHAVDTGRRLREWFVADFRTEPCIVVHTVHTPEEREDGALLVHHRLVARLPLARFEVSTAAQRGLRSLWHHIVSTGDEWTRLDFTVTQAGSVERAGRWVSGGDRPAPLDDLGFLRLDAARAQGAVNCADLLLARGQIMLVTAGPWVGKSHVARDLRDRAQVRVGRFQLLVEHEVPALPTWWRRWRHSSAHAVWLIDGLDEVFHASRRKSEALCFVDAWNDLLEEERRRLTLVVFSRPDATRDALRRACPRLVELSLLPVDRQEAERALGLTTAGLAALDARIRALGDSPLRSQIKALEVLRDAGENLTGAELRRRVLQREVTGPARLDVEIGTPPDVLFDVASDLALATLVCQEELLQLGEQEAGLNVAALLAHAPELIAATRDLRRTPALEALPGGHRFRLQWLREQLAAAWLSKHEKRSVWGAVLANEDGLRESMRAVADVLRADDERASSWVSELETPPPLSPTAIEGRLSALVEAAKKGRAYLLPHLERLSRLASPATKERAWRLLGQGDLALRELGLALLGADLGEDDAARLARIATDESAHDDLRHAVVFLLLRSEAAANERQRLYEHARAGLRRAGLRAARAAVLLDASNRGAPLRDLVSQADPSERWTIDHRSLLLSELARRLKEDADGAMVSRSLLDAWSSEPEATESSTNLRPPPADPEEFHPDVVRALLPEAIERCVADTTQPGDAARFRHVLERGCGDWGFGADDARSRDLVEAKLAGDPSLRRAVFAAGSERLWQSSWPRLAEDDRWLLAHASALDPLPPTLERAVAALAFGDGAASADARALLETRGRWQDIAARQAAAAASLVSWQERIDAREAAKPKRRRVADLVEGAFVEAAPEQVVRYLGEAFYTGEWGHPGVDGNVEELEETQQRDLIRRAREVLALALPTELPREGDFNQWHLWESATFAAAVTFDDDAPWLSHELVMRWLPTVLRVGMHRLTETLDRCARAAWDATSAAVTREVDVNAACNASHLMWRLPGWFWLHDGDLVARIEKVLRDDAAFAGTDGSANRRALLRTLAERHPRSPLLLELARHGGDAALADEALGWALREGPASVLERVERDRLSGDRLLRIVAPLFAGDGPSPAVSTRWTPEDLLALLAPLERAIARTDSAPPVGVYTGSPTLDASDGRDRLLSLLLKRAEKEPHAMRCLDRLRAEFPALEPDITSRLAGHAIEAALDADRPLSVAEAGELLREHARLPIRTEGVFFARLTELLEEIAKDTRSDAALVMDRDGEGRAKPGHEVTLLQAYLHRRIKDRSSAAHIALRLVWSPMDDTKNIPDFLAVLGKMEVPIEVKWSHHPHVKTAYRTQLADGYCSQRSFGIYVVARSTQTSDDAWREIEAELERTREDLRPRVSVAHVLLDFRPKLAASDGGRDATAMARVEGASVASLPVARSKSARAPGPKPKTAKPRGPKSKVAKPKD